MIWLRLLLGLFTALDWLMSPMGFAIAVWLLLYGFLIDSPYGPLLAYGLPTLLAFHIHTVLQEWG